MREHDEKRKGNTTNAMKRRARRLCEQEDGGFSDDHAARELVPSSLITTIHQDRGEGDD